MRTREISRVRISFGWWGGAKDDNITENTPFIAIFHYPTLILLQSNGGECSR